MKKIFTLLTLALLSIGTAWADDTYTVSFPSSTWTQSTANYFTSAGSSNSTNTKFVCKYNGTDYAQGLKMESNTKVQFTTTRSFDITIVRSTKAGSDKTISFGTAAGAKSALSFGATLSDANNTDVAVATLTGQTAGTYQIVRGSGEAGIVYVSVTEKGAAMTKLSTPTITYVAATGAVTIGAVANATKVTYTTDGTEPTASSTTYSASFNVEDGTVVKAIAIGNGTTYSNSNVASETVLFTGIKIATPVINKFNGAVAITCASPNATIKYSTNGGDTYNTYSRPFTLTADATIKAHAERTGCTNSDDASEDVTVLATNKTKTIYLDYNDFTISTYTATGKTATDANGYTLTIGNTDKSWSSNGYTIKTRGGTKNEFKLSNGAQNTLTIPDGVHVTKLTIYSIVNEAKASANVNGWKEVGGVTYQSGANDYKNVPMGAFNDLADYNTNPDVRVYDIDQTGGTITFTNAGNQLCFVLALDILENTTTITPTKEYVTYVAPANLDFTGLDIKAYVATTATSGTVTMEPVTIVPAGTPLVLKKASAASYDVPVVASASAPSTNLLKVSNGVGAIGGDGVYDYILSDGKFYHASAGVLPAGKCYLHLDAAPSGARELSLSFEDEATGVNEVRGKKEEGRDEFYNLQGRKVAQPTKGLYIVNGKKVIVK